MWRVAWVGGVFVLFAVVVWSAFDRAPRPGAPVPVVRADPAPFKEVVELPPVEAAVPRSTVLNLLAEADRPAGAREVARLDEALAEDQARMDAIAKLEEALNAIEPGEPIATMDGDDVETMEAEAPTAPAPNPTPRPSPAEAAPEEATQRLAAVGDGGFRIQLAAVKPGEEMATYSRLEQRFPVLLAGLTPRFQAISTSSGVLVRVQAGPIESQGDAEARCRSVREAGGDCFVVPVTG